MTEKHPLAAIWDRTYQVGVVVRDLDRARAFYERLGIGPFTEGPSADASDRRIYGTLVPDARVRGAVAQMGPIEFELLQPVSGQTIQQEFLDTRGEGLIHICAYTDNIARDTKTMHDLGFEPISSAVLSDGGKFAYFDTRSIGGVVLELFEVGTTWR